MPALGFRALPSGMEEIGRIDFPAIRTMMPYSPGCLELPSMPVSDSKISLQGVLQFINTSLKH